MIAVGTSEMEFVAYDWLKVRFAKPLFDEFRFGEVFPNFVRRLLEKPCLIDVILHKE